MAVLFAVMWLVFSGKLVPARTVSSMRQDFQATITRQQEEITAWRDAWSASTAVTVEKTAQISALLDIGRVSATALQSLSVDGRPTT